LKYNPVARVAVVVHRARYQANHARFVHYADCNCGDLACGRTRAKQRLAAR
jgi:hypothetical protein